MARRRTAGEIREVVQQYTASGLSQREFSQQTGIKLSTLGRYVRYDRRSDDRQQFVKNFAGRRPIVPDPAQ